MYCTVLAASVELLLMAGCDEAIQRRRAKGQLLEAIATEVDCLRLLKQVVEKAER